MRRAASAILLGLAAALAAGPPAACTEPLTAGGGVLVDRLEERLLSSLSLARKAGQLVTGSTKVKSAIEAG